MALIYEAWEKDGPNGCARVAHVRSDAAGHSPTSMDVWMAKQQADRRVVLITKARTDRQSNWEKTLWTRPGYIDA